MSKDSKFLSAEGISATPVERSGRTAADIHDWQRQPPRIRARDVARHAGIQPTPSAPLDPLGATLPTVRNWETEKKEGGATDETGAYERWGITITIHGLPFAVELLWHARQIYKHWLILCQTCAQRKSTLWLVAGSLQCRKCAGVKVLSSACPSILKPLKRLTQAEKAQKAKRKHQREQRKWARVAAIQAFNGRCEVAQTFTPSTQVQSTQQDTDD